MDEVNNTTATWQIYRTRFLIKARQLTEPLAFVDSLGREHRGQPGDYLVESSDGSRSIQRRGIFEDVYVPMTPEETKWPIPREQFSPESRRRAASHSAIWV